MTLQDFEEHSDGKPIAIEWLASALAGRKRWPCHLVVAVWPVLYLKNVAPSRHEYDRGIESDFESGRCPIYQTAPMEMLPEPAYGRDCLYIYLSRKFDNTIPYTLEAYKTYSSARDWQQYLAVFAVGTASVIGVLQLAKYSDPASTADVRRHVLGLRYEIQKSIQPKHKKCQAQQNSRDGGSVTTGL